MTGYDVEGALARGGPAVDVLSDYVAACRALGHPGADPAELHDAYTAEDGMDLGALDADCAAVAAALGVVQEAARLQELARTSLEGGWQGPGADVAEQVIAAHAQSSESAIAALDRVADTLTELRDTLWQLVSGKVSAVQDIEDRAEREHWWPAARAVATGAGSQDTASEIVDGKVNPFVAVAIGTDWADVMDSTKRSVRDAYNTAAEGISGGQPAAFGSPMAPPGAMPTAAASPVDLLPPPTAPMPAGDPFSAGLPAGGMGSGMSSVGTGLTGAGQQLADLIGGLLSSGGDSLTGDVPDLGEQVSAEPDLDNKRDDEDDDGDEDEEGEDQNDEDEDSGEAAPDPAAEVAEVAEPIEPVADVPVATPVPESVPVAPPAEPAVPAPGSEPPRTPCEIAADELPQAGE